VSPFPKQLIDRWEDRHEAADPEQGMVYWHVLLGDHSQFRKIARTAQERLSRFDGLHMTPLQWLHITTLVAGSTSEISGHDMKEMLAKATLSLSAEPPITIELGHVLYHPEAIMLGVRPAKALNPVLEVAQHATYAVTGREGTVEDSEPSWMPHVTLCYSTSRQPAEPIIAALGKELPSCEIAIKALSLVIQRGPERSWDWRPVGAAYLLGEHRK
jgi:2'-5' RNA ligase